MESKAMTRTCLNQSVPHQTVLAAALAIGCIAAPLWADAPSAQPDRKKPARVGDLSRMWKWVSQPSYKTVAPEKVIDGFIKSIADRKDLDQAKRDAIVKTVRELAADPERRASALTEALAAMNPDLASALSALANEDIAKAAPMLATLVQSSDDYVKADAAYFLARAFAMDEKCEQALPHLKELTGKLADKTLYGGDALFLLAACQTQLLQRAEAIGSFERFLKQYPDAPERLRVGAFRQLEELKAIKNGSLVDVEDRMVFSRRKLALEDAGDQTRLEQGRIVAMLDKLIKEAEDRENGS
jgi:TolA-binding protein